VCCISAAKVAAEVAADGVLPEGCWTLGAVKKLGVLALSKEVVLGIDLRAVEYILSWLGNWMLPELLVWLCC
jgi:hypothetical protein